MVGLTNSQSRCAEANHPRTSALPDTGNFFDWNGSYPEPTWGALNVSAVTKTRQTGYYGAARLSLADRSS